MGFLFKVTFTDNLTFHHLSPMEGNMVETVMAFIFLLLFVNTCGCFTYYLFLFL